MRSGEWIFCRNITSKMNKSKLLDINFLIQLYVQRNISDLKSHRIRIPESPHTSVCVLVVGVVEGISVGTDGVGVLVVVGVKLVVWIGVVVVIVGVVVMIVVSLGFVGGGIVVVVTTVVVVVPCSDVVVVVVFVTNVVVVVVVPGDVSVTAVVVLGGVV